MADSGELDFVSLASVESTGSIQEAVIVIPGPPIEVFGQRGAPSVVLKPLKQTKGKFYYECKTSTGGYMQLGWADDGFSAAADTGQGCGDDSHSWAYDGTRTLKWHANAKEPYGRKWKEGDTVGIAVDLDQGEVSFSLNGDWSSPMGTAFTGITPDGGIYPCLSLIRGQRVSVHLGTPSNPFDYNPPEGYLPLRVTQPVAASSDDYSRFASFANVIQMNLSEHCFAVSYPGELMVTMMGRGLGYEAKKNAMMHSGYEATMKRWQDHEKSIKDAVAHIGLTRDETMAVICYTLESPPVYRYFNSDTRKGYLGDGMDFPIISYLLREACRKILAATPKEQRTRIVYRGVNLPFAAEIGQVVRFGSYTSTTGNITTAEEFRKTSTGTQFVIVTKLGASIRELSAFPEEEEVLLPPYEAFRVHRVEPGCIYVASVFENDFVEQYCRDGGAVNQAQAIVKDLISGKGDT
ncbi:uncharacterized protein LOC5504108 [Nematostella vectensis]|uniref:uncharacterized protein LOC5504108 n=1 Tax=Nematostella vectensis TaxID=45351 RepID=UPI00138FE96E|nr:uncharacterized protein LOC5504108 [Nematostella vectensis]